VKYILGIDQGGTKTSVALSDLNGHILATKDAYGSCHSIYDMNHAMKAIDLAIEQIMQDIFFHPSEIAFVVCGMTGADFDFEYVLLKENVAQIIGVNQEKVKIENDSIIALRGGTESNYGAVICAGTGLNCAFINKKGQEYILGYYIEDAFQGATGLGQKAMMAVFNQESGVGKQTLLKEKVLEFYEVKNVDDLLVKYIFDQEIKGSVKNLTPLIFECVEQEDKIATDIVLEFANQWSKYIMAGVDKVSIDYPFDLVFSGGVFKSEIETISSLMMKKLKEERPNITFVQARYEPVVGAVKMALDVASTIDPTLREKNVNQSAKTMNLLRKWGN